MMSLKIQRVLILTSLFAGVVYFSYHGLYGERGFFTHEELRRQHAALSNERAILRQQRSNLEKRVRAMGSEGLDLDLLDEQVRLSFKFAHPDEIIVFEGTAR